jgi:ABC-2 type transport system ATP-binding protein
MSVPAGKLIGFLGPNGAGKTTTIRILLGLLKASGGTAEIFGTSCWRRGRTIRKEIGYLPGDVRFYSNLTGESTLRFLAHARGADCRDEIQRLAAAFDLPLSRSVRKYSSGMKQKLGLIQAMMHRPQLLVLDEPTNSLDPLIRRILFAELRRVTTEGRSVLFSSHALAEVQELCDEVIILRDGRLVEHQSIDKLRRRAVRHVIAQYASGAAVPECFPADVQITQREGAKIEFRWVGTMDNLLSWLHGQQLEDAEIGQPDLEDLFLTYYAGDSAAGSAAS